MGLFVLFCYFFLALLSFLVVIAGINRSVGVRRAYVELLLRIFEVSLLDLDRRQTSTYLIDTQIIILDTNPLFRMF